MPCATGISDAQEAALPTWISVGMVPYVVYKVTDMGWESDDCNSPERPFFRIRFWFGMVNNVQVLDSDYGGTDAQEQGMRVGMVMQLVDRVEARVTAIGGDVDGRTLVEPYDCTASLWDHQDVYRDDDGVQRSVPNGLASAEVGEARSTLGVIGRADVIARGTEDEHLDILTLDRLLEAAFAKLFGERLSFRLQIDYTHNANAEEQGSSERTVVVRRCLDFADLQYVTSFVEEWSAKVRTEEEAYVLQRWDVNWLEVDAALA